QLAFSTARVPPTQGRLRGSSTSADCAPTWRRCRFGDRTGIRRLSRIPAPACPHGRFPNRLDWFAAPRVFHCREGRYCKEETNLLSRASTLASALFSLQWPLVSGADRGNEASVPSPGDFRWAHS